MKKIFKNSIPFISGILLAILISIPLSPGEVSFDSEDYSTNCPGRVLSSQDLELTKTSYEESSSSITESSVLSESNSQSLQETSLESYESTTTDLHTEFTNIPMTKELKLHIKEMCKFYNFEEELVYQIIYRESRYDPYADNGLCQGLMQLNKNYVNDYATMDDGAYEISEDYDVFDPYTNVVLGLRCLSDWRRMGTSQGYTDLYDWLSFYNMGWSYKNKGSNGYAEMVLNTDLETIDFSNYKIIG